MKSLSLRYSREDSWPALAWLAQCRRGNDVVEVIHGPGVEVAANWFCEAVWDGSYEDGDFDRTDLVFGSGGRARGGSLTFVSSGGTVDRLQALESSGEVLISNSLPCLLAMSRSQLDPAYPHYFRDFSSIRLGLARYAPWLETSRGVVQLIYFRNVTWDGRRLQLEDKPHPARDFGSFERYRSFLESSLGRLAANLTAPARHRPFRLIGTISSGYDSPEVAALARPAGLRDVISFASTDETDSDSGREIAERLGLRVRVIARDGWKASRLAEVPFLAADAKGEDVYFKSAEAILGGSVLLTGYHGDKIWDTHTPGGALGPDLVRGDQSGLSLTEYRLRAGFLHCPVPFMGVRQIRDVNALSRSAALSRWDVGGNYSRPICRRIVEEAGVPRELFGRKKRASSVLFFHGSSFLTPEALAEYLPWLAAQGHSPSTTKGRWSRLAQAARVAERFAGSHGLDLLERAAHRIAGWADREPLFQWVFPWAAERAQAAYAAA